MALNPDEIKKINDLYKQLDDKDNQIQAIQNNYDRLHESIGKRIDDLFTLLASGDSKTTKTTKKA